MLSGERREYILEMLNKNGSISVPEIARMLNVSESTVRRDLNRLARAGRLRRIHGGALKSEPVGVEMLFDVQKDILVEEKMRIGKRAAELIDDGDVIIIEAGTTNLQLAKNIDKNLHITVITNSPDIAVLLRRLEANITVILTGGLLRHETSALIGPQAEKMLKEVHADKAFIGLTGLTIEEGITVTNLFEAEIRKRMIEAANKVIALGDHSKFGRVSMNFVAPITAIDIIVTDSGLDEAIKKEIEELGIEIILC